MVIVKHRKCSYRKIGYPDRHRKIKRRQNGDDIFVSKNEDRKEVKNDFRAVHIYLRL